MSTYLLIHGAWHGGWAWNEVADSLKKQGHVVITPDLPGHGDPHAPIDQMTMKAYVQSLHDLMQGQTSPVVLAGHSMSGAVISQVAEQCANKVATLVYVCAFLLPNGGTVLQAMKEDHDGEFLPRLKFTEDQKGAICDDATLREVFYNETPEKRIAWAKPQLLDAQPTEPFNSAITITEKNFGQVPRAYVKCMRDKILTPRAQQRMIDALPCRNVFSLDADHAPFLSKPRELADILLSL